MRIASGPDPPGSSRCVIERRKSSVPRVYLSVTLATPASSGSTDTSWLCRGRLPPIPAPPETGCPQLRSPAATGTTMQVFHLHSINKRLTAHRRRDAPAQVRSDDVRAPGRGASDADTRWHEASTRTGRSDQVPMPYVSGRDTVLCAAALAHSLRRARHAHPWWDGGLRLASDDRADHRSSLAGELRPDLSDARAPRDRRPRHEP